MRHSYIHSHIFRYSTLLHTDTDIRASVYKRTSSSLLLRLSSQRTKNDCSVYGFTLRPSQQLVSNVANTVAPPVRPWIPSFTLDEGVACVSIVDHLSTRGDKLGTPSFPNSYALRVVQRCAASRHQGGDGVAVSRGLVRERRMTRVV